MASPTMAGHVHHAWQVGLSRQGRRRLAAAIANHEGKRLYDQLLFLLLVLLAVLARVRGARFER
jgi:hypothetical protein